jgi:hypothetical protein
MEFKKDEIISEIKNLYKNESYKSEKYIMLENKPINKIELEILDFLKSKELINDGNSKFLSTILIITNFNNNTYIEF